MKLAILAVPVVAAMAIGCGSTSRPPSDCTAPCAGDPIDDFSEEQGGTNGRWRYLVDTRAANGAVYEEMTFGTVRGAPGWVGSVGTSPPGILSCADHPDTQGCADFDASLMFYPGTDGDPALAFVAADHGTYAVSGRVRSATGNPEGLPQRFLLSRNSRHDLLDNRVHVTSPVADEFTAEVELLAGDRLILTFVGGMTESVPVAFDYHLTLVASGAAAFPGKCQMSVTFDGSDPMADPCRTALEDLNDGIGPAGMSTQGASVTAEHGMARVFAEGQFLRSPGGPLDRSGDFTLQFWARVDEPPGTPAAFYADWNIDALGGFNLSPDDPNQIYLCSFWQTGTTEGSCGQGTRPTDGAWHFYRVRRSVETAALQLCIDGRLVANDPNPGGENMTGDQLPHIARNVDFNPAVFAGAMDDIRAFKAALPCPTP